MKKNQNILMEDYNDFQPKKSKQIKKFKSNQVSFSELDFDKDYEKDWYPQHTTKKKNVNFKQY
jgi:hypothetical protein